MHDLRYAFRLIRQNWGFSLAVIAILALCIGANTAVLAVVNSAMLRPLPYTQPDRLAQIVLVFQRQGASNTQNWHDGRTWEAIRDHASSLDAAVYTDWITGVNLGVDGNGVYVKQQRVASGFFRVLGVRPALGREFTQSGSRYFHGDAGVLGKGVILRGEPYTVVGVMPAGFRSDSQTDLWTPIRPSTLRAKARVAITGSWRASGAARVGSRP